MFFSSWEALARIVVVGTLGYAALVLVLRLSGKRTLSKMNAFDFVITVALGSTFAATLLSKDTPLVDGLVALSLLVLLQYVVTWLSVRSEGFQRLIKAQPTLLFYQGRFLEEAMRRERVSTEEIRAAIRASGGSSMTDAAGVVLETDGTMVVIESLPSGGKHEALASVAGTDRLDQLDDGQRHDPVAT